MIIAANDYYENGAINLKGGECQKRSAAYVSGQTKNVFPAKKMNFTGTRTQKFFPEFYEKNPSAGFHYILHWDANK